MERTVETACAHCTANVHATCLAQWVAQQGTCPTCRSVLDEDVAADPEPIDAFIPDSDDSDDDGDDDDGDDDEPDASGYDDYSDDDDDDDDDADSDERADFYYDSEDEDVDGVGTDFYIREVDQDNDGRIRRFERSAMGLLEIRDADWVWHMDRMVVLTRIGNHHNRYNDELTPEGMDRQERRQRALRDDLVRNGVSHSYKPAGDNHMATVTLLASDAHLFLAHLDTRGRLYRAYYSANNWSDPETYVLTE